MGKCYKWLFALLVCLCMSCVVSTPTEANHTIRYYLSVDGILTISGSGTLKYSDCRSISDNTKRKVKKIVINEGITELGEQALLSFYNVKSLVLPNSLIKIGKDSFSGCYYLNSVTLGGNLREIGDGAFSSCYSLESINIPDSVTSIGNYSFSNCKKLKKIILPSSLTDWKRNALQRCPLLKTVINHSKISCKLDDCKGYRIWKINGERVRAVKKGKTATASGVRVPIHYKLQGGTKTGKLPSSYEYGKKVKIPLNVKKKGYQALAWQWDGKNSYDDITFNIGPSAKKVTLTPCWFKYKIKNHKPGMVQVTIMRDKWYLYSDYEIRYSERKDMKNAKKIWLSNASNKNNKVTVTGLAKERTYYFQFRAYVDNESSGSTWIGKRKVRITK